MSPEKVERKSKKLEKKIIINCFKTNLFRCEGDDSETVEVPGPECPTNYGKKPDKA